MKRGSILVIVLVTLLFAATALVAFLDRAGTDLLVEARASVADRLRADAYSSLEVTLAVLEDFRQADNGLHSPSEGWADPLGWAAWTPADGNSVEVSFQDESAKIPLIHADASMLANMFQAWNMQQSDAQHLADVLMAWMQQNYIPSSGLAPDYEQSATPYDPPLRPLRSFGELAAIDYARDVFYDENGRLNDKWWRFYNDFSIFDFPHPNINGANSDILAGLGPVQRQCPAERRRLPERDGRHACPLAPGEAVVQLLLGHHGSGRRRGQRPGLRHDDRSAAHHDHRPRQGRPVHPLRGGGAPKEAPPRCKRPQPMSATVRLPARAAGPPAIPASATRPCNPHRRQRPPRRRRPPRSTRT